MKLIHSQPHKPNQPEAIELDPEKYQNKKSLLTGLFMALIITMMPIGGMVSADEGATANDGHGPINLAIILHMHQPYYLSLIHI